MGRVIDGAKNAVKAVANALLDERESLASAAAKAKAALTAAENIHAATEKESAKAADSYAAAKSKFEANPLDDAASLAYFRAEKVVALMAERCQESALAVNRARGVAATEQSILDEYDARKAHDARVVELRQRADLEAFRDKSELLHAKIQESLDAIRTCAGQIEAMHADANAAVEELQRLGESAQKLGDHMMWLPVIGAEIDANPGCAGHVVTHYLTGTHLWNRFGQGLANGLLIRPEYAGFQGRGPVEDNSGWLDRFEAIASSASILDGFERAKAIELPSERRQCEANEAAMRVVQGNTAALHSVGNTDIGERNRLRDLVGGFVL